MNSAIRNRYRAGAKRKDAANLAIARKLHPVLVIPKTVMQIGNRLGRANRLQGYRT
jgi:hypothetical protein